MPLVLADRVKETTSTAGTGTITLAGAAAGFQSFAVIGNGNQTYYTIAGTSEWEVGIGTYTSSGTTLSRDTVLSSSTGGTKVSFSAGAKDVFVVYPSGRAVYGDTVGNVTITTNFQAARLTASDSTSNVTLLYGDAYSVSGASAVPMVDMSGIWNTTGDPTLVRYNVTNTASGTNSLLLDLQTGGTSRFKVDKNGGTTLSTITGAAASYCNMDTIQGNVVIAATTPTNTQIFYSDSGSISGASAVALFDIAATWNTTGSPTGFKLNVTDSASDTLSSFIDLQRNGSSQFKINKYGGANTRAILQTATITAAAPSAPTNYDVITQVVQYYTTDATTNFTLNFRGNSTISLNSYMAIGQSVEVVLLVTNGATPYYPNLYQIDGTGVTPKWITGVAPTAGNANSVDVYTFTIVKTAAATFTVFASQNKFA